MLHSMSRRNAFTSQTSPTQRHSRKAHHISNSTTSKAVTRSHPSPSFTSIHHSSLERILHHGNDFPTQQKEWSINTLLPHRTSRRSPLRHYVSNVGLWLSLRSSLQGNIGRSVVGISCGSGTNDPAGDAVCERRMYSTILSSSARNFGPI